MTRFLACDGGRDESGGEDKKVRCESVCDCVCVRSALPVSLHVGLDAGHCGCVVVVAVEDHVVAV